MEEEESIVPKLLFLFETVMNNKWKSQMLKKGSLQTTLTMAILLNNKISSLQKSTLLIGKNKKIKKTKKVRPMTEN